MIALCHIYHGNNLLAFGLDKGAKEIENQNAGMYIPDISVLSQILPEDELKKTLKTMGNSDPMDEYRNSVLASLREMHRDSENLKKLGLSRRSKEEDDEMAKSVLAMHQMQITQSYEDFHSGNNLDMFDTLNDF